MFIMLNFKCYMIYVSYSVQAHQELRRSNELYS
nr:MAG TPA: hypothetical protein [Crassvirales sp.]